ncbi:PadR family transcriptional regulator [Conexibacter sp. DBS9H8]|uniref:PadR family transcriptional regulator n=1 Tax=Conexibacter sp. DBS9H8 TaxID=2937801 RepID=UPI00200C871D|nr:PadR family transcriptional regulator [Conexibacter sp. DBS9H8]
MPAPAPLTQTARIVLGLIAEGHATGYAIKAEVERSTKRYWGASIGGIYPELRRLTDAGLITVRDDPRGDSPRHNYELTEAGAAALRRWLTDCENPTLEMRDESLLRLRFANVLTRAERSEVLATKRRLHQERAAEIEAQLSRDEFDDRFHRLTAEYAHELHRWAISWCERQAVELTADGALAPVSEPDAATPG